MTDTAVGHDSVEAVLQDLQTTRASTASAILAGRPTEALSIGSDGLDDARRRIAPLDVGRHRIAYDELTAVVENDLEIARAMTERRYPTAVRGLLRHYRLTGRRAALGAVAVAGAVVAVVVPVGVALSVVLGSVPGIHAILRYYAKSLVISACPHGNFTISGRCRRPPCPA